MAPSTNWQWATPSGRMRAWTGQGHRGPLRATEGHLHDHLHLPEAPSTPHRDPLYSYIDCTLVSWVAPVASRMCSAKPLSFSTSRSCAALYISLCYAVPICSANSWVSAVASCCIVRWDSVIIQFIAVQYLLLLSEFQRHKLQWPKWPVCCHSKDLPTADPTSPNCYICPNPNLLPRSEIWIYCRNLKSKFKWSITW